LGSDTYLSASLLSDVGAHDESGVAAAEGGVKTGLFIAMFFIMAIPVGAVEGIAIDKNGKPIYTLTLPAMMDNHGNEVRTACEVKLEAAMRAMEPYIANVFVRSLDFEYLEGWTPTGQAKFDRANKLWEATQRECWKDVR
jgi:hypothetical protein